MHAEEIIARMATVGAPLVPFQERFVRSEADAISLYGGPGTGKSFCIAPWLLGLDPDRIHAIAAATMVMLRHELPQTLSLLEAVGVGYAFGRVPPSEWRITRHLKSYHDVLTLETGAHVLLFSLARKQYRACAPDSLFLEADHVDVDDIWDVTRRAERVTVAASFPVYDIPTRNGGGSHEAIHADRCLVGALIA